MRTSESSARGTTRLRPVGAILSYVASVIVVAAAACAGPSTGVAPPTGSVRPLGQGPASQSSPAPLCSPSPTYQCIVVPFDTTRGFKALPVLGGFGSGVKLSRNQFEGQKLIGPTVGVATQLPPGLLPFPGPTPLLYFTEQTPVNVAMDNVSSFTVTLPGSINPKGKQFYISYLDPNNLGAGWQTVGDMVLQTPLLTFEPGFFLRETWLTGQLYGFAIFELPNPSPLPTGTLYYTEQRHITQISTGLGKDHVVGRLSGPFAQLFTSGNTAFDSAGNFYEANVLANNPSYVTEFAAGAIGDVPPIATISGSNTLLQSPNSVAIDSSGDIYVADTNYINIYPPNSNGNVAPSAQILVPGTSAIAFDSSNDLYVRHSGCGIQEYAPGVVGTPAPIRCMNVSAPFALDAPGNLYACSGNSILVYTPTDVSPSRVISGVFTGITCTTSITVGATGYIYIQTGFNSGHHVIVFTPTASGNTPYIQKISTTNVGFLNIWPNR